MPLTEPSYGAILQSIKSFTNDWRWAINDNQPERPTENSACRNIRVRAAVNEALCMGVITPSLALDITETYIHYG